MEKKMQITDMDFTYDPSYVRLQFDDKPFWVGIEVKKITAYIADSKNWLYDTLENNLVIPNGDNACTIMSFRTYYEMYPKQCTSYIQNFVNSRYEQPVLEVIDQAINDQKNGW